MGAWNSLLPWWKHYFLQKKRKSEELRCRPGEKYIVKCSINLPQTPMIWMFIRVTWATSLEPQVSLSYTLLKDIYYSQFTYHFSVHVREIPSSKEKLTTIISIFSMSLDITFFPLFSRGTRINCSWAWINISQCSRKLHNASLCFYNQVLNNNKKDLKI